MDFSLNRVSGGELFQKIVEQDNLNEPDAARYIIQVLQGVRHMHRQNIVHLDLKVGQASFHHMLVIYTRIYYNNNYIENNT